MNMEMIKSILLFAGGLGLFIYGMEVMAEGLQKAAGDKTRKLLESLTRNRLMGVRRGSCYCNHSVIECSNRYDRRIRKCVFNESFSGCRSHHGCQYWYDDDCMDCLDG